MKHMKIMKKKYILFVVFRALLFIAKIPINSQESLLRLLTPDKGSPGESLAFEYRTGRLVFCLDGGFADE